LHVAGNDATYTLKGLLLLASLASSPAQRALFLISGEITKVPPSLEWLVGKRPEKMAIRRQNKKITLMAKEKEREVEEKRGKESDTTIRAAQTKVARQSFSTVSETKD